MFIPILTHIIPVPTILLTPIFLLNKDMEEQISNIKAWPVEILKVKLENSLVQ
jgi:uncharacterized membrane protein YGL010W